MLAELRTHLPLVVDTKKGSDSAEEEQHQFARLGVEQLIQQIANCVRFCD